jgi:CheY-like chemotaxis protein
VKQHNGFVNVYSEPDMGTTFRIYLPTVDAVDKEEKPAPALAAGGNETILVAEDNEAVRGLMCRILKEYGYATVEACNGAEAIEQFKKTDKIDLLVLDSVMPVQNGRKAYDVIFNMRPDIKVLFTSGYTRDVVLDKGIEDKKFDFISKPVSPNALLQKVREVLDGGGMQ